MRLFYELTTQDLDKNSVQIDLRLMTNTNGDSEVLMSTVLDTKKHQLGEVTTAMIEGCVEAGTWRTIRAIGEMGNLRPIQMIEAVREGKGRQVVWDERMNKWRNVSTMRDDRNAYKAVGTDITVEAKNEKDAKRFATREITEQMVENPSDAAKLSKWFADGATLKLVDDGAAPEYLTLESLVEMVAGK